MKINTRDFGEIDINEEDIIAFVNPVIGFATYSKYVFLYEDGSDQQFARLQSVEEPMVCFIVCNPFVVKPDYKYTLPDSVKKILGEGSYDAWLVTVVTEDIKKSTVNMKSPIIVNPVTKQALQLVLDDDYEIRYPLFPEKGGS